MDAALQLCATQGYDATTTEQIAEVAGVSPRTFFRYFPTKESVLLFGEYDFIRSFTGVYLAQPDTITELEAISAAFTTLAPEITHLRKRITLYRQAVASSPTLRGRERSSHQENAETVAQAIAQRRGLSRPDESCELLADISLVVFDRSVALWSQSRTRLTLTDTIATEFGRLGELVRQRTDVARPGQEPESPSAASVSRSA